MKARKGLATLLVLGLGLGTVSASACSKGDARATPSGADSGLQPRNITAGSVQVLVTPIRVDSKGAVFDISMDTHSGDLGSDLEQTAKLVVGGTAWSGVSWTGDPPGGHHREGSLSFRAEGPASGTAVLSIGGFPGPVEASWTLSGSGATGS